MRLSTKTLLATALLACCSQAFAAVDTTTFQVQIIITESCDIHTTAATDVDFSSHARSTGQWDAAGNLVVNCSTGTPYTIGLSNGTNPSSPTVSATNRQMTNGSNVVPYGLYQDGGRTQLWGSTIATDTFGGTGTGVNVDVPVYGRVLAASTNVPAGTYLDTVTATITY